MATRRMAERSAPVPTLVQFEPCAMDSDAAGPGCIGAAFRPPLRPPSAMHMPFSFFFIHYIFATPSPPLEGKYMKNKVFSE